IGATNYNIGTQSANHGNQINIVWSLNTDLRTHQLKTGVDYRLLENFQSGIATNLLLQASSIQAFAASGQITRLTDQTFRASTIKLPFVSLFAQDSWRTNPRLTLTYGVRWELNPAPSGSDGTQLGAWQDTETPALTVLAPAGTPVWRTRYNN